MTDLPTLVFATQNEKKLEELRILIAKKAHLISLNELDFNDEIPETTNTLEGNAYQKALTIYNRFGKPCFSDDSGLFVKALGGAPGVDSACYSGGRDSHKNMALLLDNLALHQDRSAYFKTVFCLITHDDTYYFEGIVDGIITTELRGTNGFGYDPIFLPKGSNKTFAEMSLAEKAVISHRGLAVAQLVNFLKSY